MKKKSEFMKKKTIIGIIIIAALLIFTGCGNKNADNSKNKSKSDPNSIVGTYELEELKAEGVVINAQDWKRATTLEYSLEVKSDNTAAETMNFKENMNGKDMSETSYYTYDGEYFYGTNNEGTEEGKTYYKYEYKDNTLTLNLVNSKHDDCYVYKKK